MCVFNETCGLGLAIEHNGDLYSCDHFVEPNYRLGNIADTDMIELVASDRQRKFGQDKLDTLPSQCLKCEVRFACHGECPKNRFTTTTAGDPGLNYLCAGWYKFFTHIDHPMKIMVSLMRAGRPAAGVMSILAREEAEMAVAVGQVGRNDLCPCGSGFKSKKCHGRQSASAAPKLIRLPVHQAQPRARAVVSE
jgi:uncharacterized protein